MQSSFVGRTKHEVRQKGSSNAKPFKFSNVVDCAKELCVYGRPHLFAMQTDTRAVWDAWSAKRSELIFSFWSIALPEFA
jgi:hypothetical protein